MRKNGDILLCDVARSMNRRKHVDEARDTVRNHKSSLRKNLTLTKALFVSTVSYLKQHGCDNAELLTRNLFKRHNIILKYEG